MRIAALIFALLAIAMTWGVFASIGVGASGPGLAVEPAEIVLPADASTFSLTMRLRNISAAPVRVIGAGTGCRAEGCVSTTTEIPLTIAPGKTAGMQVNVSCPGKGPVNFVLPLYAEEHGIVTYDITIRRDDR